MRHYSTMILLLLILFLVFPVCSASAETLVSPTDISCPTEFQVFDTPDDSNGNISLSWKAISGENDSIFYVVCIAKNAEGPFDIGVCQFPSTQRWKSDKEWPFWVSGKNEGYHYIEINPSQSRYLSLATLLELRKQMANLKEIQAGIENAKKDKNDYSELETKKKALEQEIKSFEQKVNQEANDISKYFSPTTLPELRKQMANLKEIQAGIEKAKKDKNNYSELETKKEALEKEIKTLELKVNQEADEIKNANYYFKVGIGDNIRKEMLNTTDVHSGRAKNNWFNFSRLNNFLVMIFFCGLVLWFISHAKKNQNLFLRRIAGLDAVEEAVGRATEMGRSVFYLTGIYGMEDIATICATVILGKVSEKIAQYDTQIKIPHRDPIVLTVCQEIVKESYTKAGRPDAYKSDSNFYVTGDQFAYTSAVNGMMMREKPAATFFMGSYMAEALLLTECGSATGAIQIAGSDSTDQLPFFITTCDYTLIGEEFYAASAYLSRQPVLVGTLKAQDIGKVFILTALVLGTTFATLYMPTILDLIKDFS